MKLNEQFSSSSYMELQELRELYYGRMDVYASFTNTYEHTFSNKEKNEYTRPYGILCHSVDTIVAKRAKTSLLYAFVFRYNDRSKNMISDIAAYTKIDWDEDKESLKILPFVDEDAVTEIIDSIDNDINYKFHFHKLWDATKRIAKTINGREDKVWRLLFIELGYGGFVDNGKGILAPMNQSAVLILNYDKRQDLDIMPIQKYKKDKRQSVVQFVNLRNKRMWAARNRVARRRTPMYRTDGITSSFGDYVRDAIKLLKGGL